MEPSSAKAKPQGRLLVSTSLDAKDELEEVGERRGGEEEMRGGEWRVEPLSPPGERGSQPGSPQHTHTALEPAA